MDRIHILSTNLVTNTTRPNLIHLKFIRGDLEFLTKGGMAPALVRLLYVVQEENVFLLNGLPDGSNRSCKRYRRIQIEH